HGARGDHDDGGRHGAPLLAWRRERDRGPRARPDQGLGAGVEDPQAGPAGEAALPALQGPARGAGPHRPGRRLSLSLSFKDFFQYAVPTRVIAGRGLLEGTGFEFAKEGATRVMLVTDEVIRGTGLVDKVTAGVEDGGLEVAGVFDGVPQDSDTEVVVACANAARDAGADSFLAVGGGSVIDTTKGADMIFTH